MRWTVQGAAGGEVVEVSLVPGGDRPQYRVTLADGTVHDVVATQARSGVWTLRVGTRVHEVVVDPVEGGTTRVSVRGRMAEVAIEDPRRKALRLGGAAGAKELRSSMPGRVVRVLVSVGQEVHLGDPLVVVEAMKMENELKANRDAKVAQVKVRDGQVVEAGAVLLELE